MKGSIACRMMLCLLSLFRPGLVFAQVWDDFSDGDFTQGVLWSGDSGAFVVDDETLQLNSTGSDSSFLSTSMPFAGDTLEWQGRLRLNFAPSSLNLVRVYLAASVQNLESSLSGYFLQVGETGGADTWVLYRQNGFQLIPLLRGRDSLLAAPFERSFKVIRFPAGRWELWSQEVANGAYIYEGSVIDAVVPPGDFFGVKCYYTSSNASGFYFDDFYKGGYVYDTIAPAVETMSLLNDSTVQLLMNERLDSLWTLDLSLFLLNGSLLPSAVWAEPGGLEWRLRFPVASLTSSVSSLCCWGLRDIAGNTMSDTVCKNLLRFGVAEVSDIVFTEVMADPGNSPSLPGYEYLEVYNRSEKVLLLSGWTLNDASSSCSLPVDTLLPGEFRYYCEETSLSSFVLQGYLSGKGVEDFPSLNNDGDHLELIDQNGRRIDVLDYTIRMYRDPLRDDEGWSLERRDVDFPCHDEFNWGASHDPDGGSPGEMNTIPIVFADTVAPYPVSVFPADSLTLLVNFSEAPDTLMLNNTSAYTLQPGDLHPVAMTWLDSISVLQLQFAAAFQQSTDYVLELDTGLADCAGNKLSRWSGINFRLPDSLYKTRILLNEILFNPHPEGSDFVEIYNAGISCIDLSEIRLAHADVETGVISDAIPFATAGRLLMPGQYAVVATDIADIRSRYTVGDLRMLMENDLPSFNDDEGIVVLLNASLQEIDRYHYRENHHFPLIDDPEGVSLERISFSRATDDSTNWHSAAGQGGGASPCRRNSQAEFLGTPDDDWLTVEPELFSPDNDGYHDVLQMACKPEKPGYVVHFRVLDAFGNTVRTLGRQELLGQEGRWNWDGLDENGQVLNPGIYILLAELFHVDGETRVLKRPCVLAAKVDQ